MSRTRVWGVWLCAGGNFVECCAIPTFALMPHPMCLSSYGVKLGHDERNRPIRSHPRLFAHAIMVAPTTPPSPPMNAFSAMFGRCSWGYSILAAQRDDGSSHHLCRSVCPSAQRSSQNSTLRNPHGRDNRAHSNVRAQKAP